MYKTHTCGELRKSDIGKEVKLAGWINRRRDHGGVTFLDLRDRFGVDQVVSNPISFRDAHDAMEPLRMEWVIQIQGEVKARPEGSENPNLETGEIEVEAQTVKVLNPAKTPPFLIYKEEEVDETIRLGYRYLDLRRERMQRNLELRHNMVKFIRDFLDEQGFLEIETPILFKSTPEGARDYLVPSRVQPGEFYALPQSPQQLKQLLMVAGVERYFQIARCFRDEDQRGDRQPEFTQLDLEMSFVEREDVMQLTENLFTKMVEKVVPHKRLLSSPWPRLTYKESLERFGKDNPDLRFGMELVDLTDLGEGSGFNVFESTVRGGGHIRGLNAKGMGETSRKQIGEWTNYVKQFGAKGLAFIGLTPEGDIRSTFSKFISQERIDEISKRMNAENGDLMLFVADKPEVVFESLGRLRSMLGNLMGLIDRDVLAFCWIIDFPFVTWNEDEKRWDPSHHLFTAPMPEDVQYLVEDPNKVRGQQYDMVLNDYEVGGGSIRIHDRELQEVVFKLIGF